MSIWKPYRLCSSRLYPSPNLIEANSVAHTIIYAVDNNRKAHGQLLIIDNRFTTPHVYIILTHRTDTPTTYTIIGRLIMESE